MAQRLYYRAVLSVKRGVTQIVSSASPKNSRARAKPRSPLTARALQRRARRSRHRLCQESSAAVVRFRVSRVWAVRIASCDGERRSRSAVRERRERERRVCGQFATRLWAFGSSRLRWRRRSSELALTGTSNSIMRAQNHCEGGFSSRGFAWRIPERSCRRSAYRNARFAAATEEGPSSGIGRDGSGRGRSGRP